jgi:mannose-1-phosphate guanylyltransferase
MPELSKKIMNKCNVMMFAAGLGTRLIPFTNTNPKPVLPLLQIPLGYYSLPYLEKIEVDSFVVNTFHLAEQVHQLYASINPAVQFSNEKDFIKGSGGGLKQAENKLNSHLPILTMNADEIFFTDESDFLKNALNTHCINKNFATLIVTEHPEAGHKFGAIWCENNKVVHIGKDKPNETAKPWHFIGLQFLSNEILNQIPHNQETNIFYDVLIHHLKSENIRIYSIKCDWYEVGNITDYQIAKSKISKNLKLNPIYQKQFQKLQLLPKSNLSDLTE